MENRGVRRFEVHRPDFITTAKVVGFDKDLRKADKSKEGTVLRMTWRQTKVELL